MDKNKYRFITKMIAGFGVSACIVGVPLLGIGVTKLSKSGEELDKFYNQVRQSEGFQNSYTEEVSQAIDNYEKGGSFAACAKRMEYLNSDGYVKEFVEKDKVGNAELKGIQKDNKENIAVGVAGIGSICTGAGALGVACIRKINKELEDERTIG